MDDRKRSIRARLCSSVLHWHDPHAASWGVVLFGPLGFSAEFWHIAQLAVDKTNTLGLGSLHPLEANMFWEALYSQCSAFKHLWWSMEGCSCTRCSSSCHSSFPKPSCCVFLALHKAMMLLLQHLTSLRRSWNIWPLIHSRWLECYDSVP